MQDGIGRHGHCRDDDVRIDVHEARLLEPARQVLGIEVLHRVIGRPAPVEVGLDALGEIAEVDELPELRVAAIDGLEDRHPTARSQHAEELARRLLFLADVDEHRAGEHHVHRLVRQRQYLRTPDEVGDTRVVTRLQQLLQTVH